MVVGAVHMPNERRTNQVCSRLDVIWIFQDHRCMNGIQVAASTSNNDGHRVVPDDPDCDRGIMRVVHGWDEHL